MKTNIGAMHIGQVIREIREARKATLEEVALAAETNASNLSRIERGTQGYSPETLERIARALGLTVSELYLRQEAAGQGAGHSAGGAPNALDAVASAILISKYAALSQQNRELIDEFMAVLLRRQA